MKIFSREKVMGPIGIFDSWYGGLTVLKNIREKLPQYDYFYLGDNARAPYGSRSFETIYQYTWEGVQKLFSFGCSLVILACNTASAKALRKIQQENLPNFDPQKRVLGVIRPTSEIIGSLTKTKHIGILATLGTINSHAYDLEIAHFSPEVQVVSEACPLLVPLIENGEYQTPWARYFIEKYLHELLTKDAQIDTIILWCTHYPLIKNQIQEIVGNQIQVLVQWEIVAESLQSYLLRHPEMEQQCTKDKKIRYFTTETPEKFNVMASLFLWESVEALKVDLC